MTEQEFKAQFQPEYKQVISFVSDEGWTETAIITSSLLTSTTGRKFVRITHHRQSTVLLLCILTIRNIGIKW